MERWLLQRGGQYREVVITERWSIQRGGQYREVVSTERWSIQTLISVYYTFYTEPGCFTNDVNSGLKLSGRTEPLYGSITGGRARCCRQTETLYCSAIRG